MERSGRRGGLASLGLLVGVATVLAAGLGGYGIVLAVLLAVVWLAWRFDNRTGSLLLLAILFLIAAAVPAMLLVLMAVTH